MTRVVRTLLIALVPLLLAHFSAAQVSRVAGALEGTVSDPTGAVVPGATIKLVNTDNGQARKISSDSHGEFRATELASGSYSLQVEHAGFAVYRHAGVTVGVGQTVRVLIPLSPDTVQEQLTVTDQPPLLDTTQSTVTTNVDTESIEELPVVSRNYLNFVLLSPGVVQSTPPQSASTQLQAVDSGFSFGGLRGRSNSLTIDGVDNNDEYTGANRTELSLEIIREFQVVNTGISAESGGASGGAINVVTKTGANVIHGDAFVFVQNGALNAREPFSDEPSKPELNRYRAGFAIGGPIRKNRTFYYTAFEQEHSRGQNASDIADSNINAINSALATSPVAAWRAFRLTPGFFDSARAETEASGKVNHQINDRQSLMLRYAFTNNREAGDAYNTSGLVDASARGSAFTEDQAAVGSWTSVLNSGSVNDLRFQLATRRVVARADRMPLGNDDLSSMPEIQIAGVADFGHPFGGDTWRRENHYEVGDMLTATRGAHLLKFGAVVNRVGLNVKVDNSATQLYQYATLSDFLTNAPDAYRERVAGQQTAFSVTHLGGFVQDHWSPSWARQMTLDLGVRYDFEKLPASFNHDANNFSPRIGVAYTPGEKWVARASYGIFFDRQTLAFLSRALSTNGVNGFERVLEGSIASSMLGFASGAGTDPRPTVPTSIYAADPQLATPYSQQASVSIERQLSKDMTASATYQFVRGIKLSRTENVNLLPPIRLTSANASLLGIPSPTQQELGRQVFGVGCVNPVYDAVYQLQNRAGSTFNGVSLSLNRRLANEVAFSGAYTFSKSLDDASDFYEQAPNPYALRSDRALSSNDQRHRFVFSGLFDLPFGDEEDKAKGTDGQKDLLAKVLGNIEVAPIFTVGSGRPYTPLVGFDAEHSRAFPLVSRPLELGRNSLRTPATANLDFRVLKYFVVKPHGKLDFVAEFFNIFNRANVGAVNPLWGPGLAAQSSFGQPINALRARQMQFSLDFEF